MCSVTDSLLNEFNERCRNEFFEPSWKCHFGTGKQNTGSEMYSLCISKTGYIAVNVVMGLIGLAGVTLNVAVLVTFSKRRSLINPFNVHIVSMSVISVLRSVIFHPLVTARPYVEGDYLRYCFFACAVFQYFCLDHANYDPTAGSGDLRWPMAGSAGVILACARKQRKEGSDGNGCCHRMGTCMVSRDPFF